jgi:Predicted membrane protein
MTPADLPPINAVLNGCSAVLLTIGYIFIRKGRRTAHGNTMIAACFTSLLFLACYVTYHIWMKQTHGNAHTSFQNPAWFRPYYLVILFTHLVAAIVIVPLVILTLFRALTGNLEKHKKVARWTWPIWMYVSVTGVLIYYLLYVRFPQSSA